MAQTILTLKARLEVPRHIFHDKKMRFTEEEVLAAFEHRREVMETVVSRDDDGEVTTAQESYVEVISAVKQTPAMLYFSRGDIGKLRKYFGAYQWDDQRAATPLAYDLKFLSDMEGKDQQRALDARLDKDQIPAITLREDQVKALDQWSQSEGGIIHADTGWGKTATTLYLLTLLKLNTLVLVEEKACGAGWLESLRRYTNLDYLEIKHKTQIAGIFRGKDFWPVTIATYQSFIRNKKLRDRKDFFGVVWVDEVDRVGAECYSKVVNSTNPVFRGGCTATIHRNDGIEGLVYDIVGPTVSRGTEKMLNAQVQFVETNVAVKRYNVAHYWTKALSDLLGDAKKEGNQKYFDMVKAGILKTAREGRSVLVISERNPILFRLFAALSQEPEFDQDMKATKNALMTFTGDSDREKIIRLSREGTCRVVLGQAKLLRRAIDVPVWDCLHLISPVSGWAKATRSLSKKEPNPELYQVVGRIRRVLSPEASAKVNSTAKWRPFKDKPVPLVYDYLLTPRGGDPRMANVGISRRNMYTQQGFEILPEIAGEDLLGEPDQPKRRRF